MRIPSLDDEDPSNPPLSEVAFYPLMFNYGVGLPLHHFIQPLLAYVAPFQLFPNSYGILLGCYVL